MLSRAISASAISSLALIVLLVAQVSAAPTMSIGSKATYNLSVKFNTSQTCNASPVVYNQTACGLPVPAYHILIIDENATVCTTFPKSCFFSPANATVQPAVTVVWSNLSRIPHAVASCDQSNYGIITAGACPVMDGLGLTSFNSGLGGLTSGQTFSYTFSVLGIYYYFDPIHPWMHGNVTVSFNAPPPPPVPVVVQVTRPPITVSGSLGWTVVGLDSSTAVLNVTHALGVFVDSIPIAPVSEAGSFQDSINLSTRAESHGTALELVDNFALAFLTGSLAGTSSLPSSAILGSNLPTVYTFWWVNGPLSNGSPVQILAGYSSVQGDETVSLPGVGPRSAWMVTSNVAEDLSTIAAQLNPSGPGGAASTNSANARVALKFDYDKSSDLLLSSADSGTITAVSTSVFAPGQILCGSSGQCTSVTALTTVTRVMTVSVTASLTLSSTSLNLDARAGGSSHGNGRSMLAILQDIISQPILVTLAGVVAAAIASMVVWITKYLNRTKARLGETPRPTSPP